MSGTLGAPRTAVFAALGTIYILWGATYLGMMVAIETLPPFLMASIRFLVAGAVLYALMRPRERPTRRHWVSAFVIGAFLLVGGNAVVAWSETRIDSGVAALIVATIPLWLAIMDFGVSGRRLSPQTLVGLVVGFAGIALLLRPGGDIDPVGAFICLLAPVSWAVGSLYVRSASRPTRPLLGAGMEMLAGGALLAVVGFATGERVDVGSVSGRSLLGLTFLIVFGSIVAYSCYTWLLKVAPTALVGTYAYVNPVIAVLLGAAFLSEPITRWMLLAGAAIVVSVALIVRAQSRPRVTPAAVAEPRQEGATLAA
jgi:drug/metabolite transporter (DMT)-like permease